PGGYAIAFAEASTIFQNENKQYQKGGTDKNGVYSFCPDKTGEWTVTIDDGTGHRGSIKISVTKEFFNFSKGNRESAADEKNKTLPAKNIVADANKNNPVNTTQPNEKKKKPLEKGALCCYLLKVLMGVLLILLITFLLHRLAKKGEKTG
ncbi:MAG: hypothetical protein GY757_24560, partial [bacterium]|nr:hypothetical protein [bacterium]